MEANKPTTDEWSGWLLANRHGGNAEYRRRQMQEVERIRDRVLDGAKLSVGMTLLDVGSGDGLMPFGAIERVGASLRAIFTDLSLPLLKYAEKLAVERGVQNQCTFLNRPADDLDGVADQTVDAVTSRAVLAYVRDKIAALRECYRVLKPGGRVSLAEPILQEDAFENCALGEFITANPYHPQIDFLKLRHRSRALQYPSTPSEIAHNPLTNFSERDLVRLAREAGFIDIHLELHIDSKPSLITDWDVFLSISPHPWAPSLEKILSEQFSDSERALFERTIRPAVESGKSVDTIYIAYMTATRPS
jgi:ubiquinone/menaquinone biosynthesis C-methylase UbiE